ncbi:hypothetical protein H8F25_12800 [Synechococcus sp. CBW1004]|nr:hypothetical protein H8F25_12800 [Synechococcus sp. CBW1004]
MRASDTTFCRSGELNADLSGLSAPIAELRQQLLSWWVLHGRHTIPWKLRPDGSAPAEGEELDPYGVLVAEVMRAAGQHSRLCSPWAEPGHRRRCPTTLRELLPGSGGLARARLLVHCRPSGDPEA